jgi:dsRNA-specific ribonuclease
MENKNINHDDDIIKSDEGLIFNPYNNNNNEITLNNVQSILSRYNINYKVNNIELYKRAFIHRSYTKRPHLSNIQENITIVEKPFDCMPLKSKSNERLEFLGDGVLECITKYYLYRRFPKENEGFMTEKKIAIVKNEAIGKLALEMGLHKWYIISKHAEEKKIRTNLKKLGCLFESFLGALFLDCNKIEIHDEDKWFDNLFVTGPGFQLAQIFVESIFEKHIDWVKLIQDDDNYKNILQVKIQKEFKTTPHYLEIDHNLETGYKMGVYLCMGQQIHETCKENAIDYKVFNSFSAIQDYIDENEKVLVFLGQGQHKIKRKAEQTACEETLKLF